MKRKPKPVGSLGEIIRGRLDYYLRPKLKRTQGGAFNGQVHRRNIFSELVSKLSFSKIVETGTYRGITTQYMHHESGLPVYTAEVNPRYYGYAKAILHRQREITIFHADSREFLRQLIDEKLLDGDEVFFYLDAHWGDDLPLLEEIEIIFANLPEAVVMIDDFKVPGDDGYAYDDYGVGKTLSLDYLQPAIEKYKISVFFPALHSAQETGAKRGCVVLASAPNKVSMLTRMTTLNMFAS